MTNNTYDWEITNCIEPVQVEGGDVLISLSPNTSDQLVLESSLLKQIPWFNAHLSSRWSDTVTATGKHPRTGEQITVWRYGLRRHEEDNYYTLANSTVNVPRPEELLESGRLSQKATNQQDEYYSRYCSCDPSNGLNDPIATHFHLLKYATGFAPRPANPLFLLDISYSPNECCLPGLYHDATRDHKLLFALLYDLRIQFGRVNTGDASTALANVIAYAEFYTCFPELSSRVATALCGLRDIWGIVCLFPHFYLTLSVKLRITSMYNEALRHIVSSWDLKEVANAIGEAFGDPTKYKLLILEKRVQLDQNLSQLTTWLNCRGSTYTFHFASKPDATIPGVWRIPSALIYADPSLCDYSDDYIQYIARRIYTEWLSCQLGSNPLVGPAIRRPNDSDPLCVLRRVCLDLIKAEKAKDTRIFGHKLCREQRDLGPDISDVLFEPEPRLYKMPRFFEKPMNDAADSKPTPAEKLELELLAILEDRKHHNFGWLFDDLEIHEWETPWYNEGPWNEVSWPDETDWKAASREWLRVVGIDLLLTKEDEMDDELSQLVHAPSTANGENIYNVLGGDCTI
ncbi:hypothetical protein AOQ84DRAFT_368287 [Glonium stellatum]|uniref:Uncharacterized protein n=1 Tax=Glonium stellatum TaxID=574774 RepID=A0A8E2ERJ5_9PEZI|nr:hypothetical protein AOQ84DRAFT_368287 [Glonium stellatum]